MENTPNIELSPKIYKRVEFLMKLFTAIREWIKNVLRKLELRYEFSLLDIKDGNVLILKSSNARIRDESLVRLKSMSYKSYPNLLIIAMSPDIDIQLLSPEAMQRFGWVKQESVIRFEDKIEEYINEFGSNTPNEVCAIIAEQIQLRRHKRLS